MRRRALLGKNVNEVFVTTCDQEIKSIIYKSGGKILMPLIHTKIEHKEQVRLQEKLNLIMLYCFKVTNLVFFQVL